MLKINHLAHLALLWIAVCAAALPLKAQTTVLTEDFSGTSNIFGVTTTTLSVGSAAIYNTNLSGFGPVLAVCNTTVEGALSASGISAETGIVTIEWDAFHGYFGSDQSTTVSLLNSNGDVIAGYVYNAKSCSVTNATIGNQAVAGFEAFSLQNANGFGGNGKPYTAANNPHITIAMTRRGGVTMTFKKGNAEVKQLLGSVGTLTKDIAKIRIASTVSNTDRCYAIDNIIVTTNTLDDDPDYIEPIANIFITGADHMTFGPSTDTPYANAYAVTITGADGTNITESTLNEKVTDFKVVWDIEGFKTANDTEGQYCDSYGSFSVNNQGAVATTFDLRDVPMNFFGRITATVTYNGTSTKASKYVVAQGNTTQSTSQVLPLPGYPVEFSTYPTALKGYTITKETYGNASDLIVGGWCVAGSDSHQATLQADADGTKYVRLTAVNAKKSHVLTQTIESPTAQTIFDTKLRFNSAGAVVTLTGGYPFWSSSKYTCPVTLNFDGSKLTLNGSPIANGDVATTVTTATWYKVVLSADKSSECCYALLYDANDNLIGKSGIIPWQESSSPTYFSIGMGNSNTGSADMAACEAFVAAIDMDTYKLTSDKTTLSIPQGEQAVLSVTVSDTHGYDITGQATWTVLEEDMQQCVSITPDATNPHVATVSLLPTAEAGIATIQVSIGGNTRTLALNLTSSAESVKFTQGTNSIAIPMDAGQTATATFSAIVIDGDGNDLSRPTVLAAYAKDGTTPLQSSDALAFNATTGVLSVKSDATPTQIIIRATGQNSASETLSKSIKVNIHGTTFDFGYTNDEGVAEGYTAVGTATTYTDDAGYGIKTGTVTAAGTTSATNAESDYLKGAMEFDIKVPAGNFYTVEITYQGVLSTGHVNSDLAGYQLGSHATMTTETYTIPAALDIIDLHIADADATSVAQIAKVTIIKQPKRQKRGKRVVHHIGDSTSANNGSWAYRLSKSSATYTDLFSLCTFQNNGAGGRNLCTYYTQGKLANVLLDICPDDIVMFGNNGTNGMGQTYEADMNYYLNAAETLGAQTIINSYTPHGAVSNYASGYNASTNTFNSYRRDSYETIVRKVAAQRAANDANYLGFVEIGKNADAIFNAYVADYAANGYASADAAAQAIISCFTDHNHYSNGTLACDLMLNGYAGIEGIVSQIISLLDNQTNSMTATQATLMPAQATYTLSGQRVAAPSKPGIYIMCPTNVPSRARGSKVIIRK